MPENLEGCGRARRRPLVGVQVRKLRHCMTYQVVHVAVSGMIAAAHVDERDAVVNGRHSACYRLLAVTHDDEKVGALSGEEIGKAGQLQRRSFDSPAKPV